MIAYLRLTRLQSLSTLSLRSALTTSRPGPHLIVSPRSIPPQDPVVAGAAVDDVLAGAARNPVVAGAAEDPVITRAAGRIDAFPEPPMSLSLPLPPKSRSLPLSPKTRSRLEPPESGLGRLAPPGSRSLRKAGQRVVAGGADQLVCTGRSDRRLGTAAVSVHGPGDSSGTVTSRREERRGRRRVRWRRVELEFELVEPPSIPGRGRAASFRRRR